MTPDFLEDLDEVAPTLHNVIPEKKSKWKTCSFWFFYMQQISKIVLLKIWIYKTFVNFLMGKGVCGVTTRTEPITSEAFCYSPLMSVKIELFLDLDHTKS